jgi:hypothetical protein
MACMSRAAFATLIGIGGFILYVMAVVALADHVIGLHWLVQLAYYVVAGVAWAWPARALMFWGARRGAPQESSGENSGIRRPG